MEITTQNIDGVTYYSTTSRGVDYTLYYQETVGAWGLSSRRKSLGRNNPGGFRYFYTLEDLEKTLKAFSGISLIVNNQGFVADA